MELELTHKGYFIEIVKDDNPINPMEIPDNYTDNEEELNSDYEYFQQGEAYGYLILDENKELVDSIWNYFGPVEINGIIDSAISRIDTMISRGELTDKTK